MISIILSLLGFLAIFLTIIFVLMLNRCLGFRVVPPSLRPIDPQTVSEDSRLILENESSDLRQLGFVFHSVYKTNNLLSDPSMHSTDWIFFHPELNVCATLSQMDVSVSQKRKTVLVLTSRKPDLLLISIPITTLWNAPGIRWQITRSSKTPEMLKQHLDWVASHPGASIPMTPESIQDLILEQEHAQYENALQQDCILTADGSESRLRFSKALRISFVLLATQPRLQKFLKSEPRVLPPCPTPLFECSDLDTTETGDPYDAEPGNQPSSSSSPEDPVDKAVENYHKCRIAMEKNNFGPTTKWILLLVSGLLFLGVFSHWISWSSALVLLGVLFLHELGHIAAMKVLGYRDLQMLFIPGLGALATGHKDGPVVAWKQVIVLLMGPLPGIILGLALLPLLFLPEFQTEIVFTTVLMLILVNLFNLLPFHPLDGGQLMGIVLFHRWPYAKAVFFLLSALALVGFGFLIESPFFILIFVFAGVATTVEAFRSAKSLRILRSALPHEVQVEKEPVLLRTILSYLQPQALSDIQRYQKAKSLLTHLQLRPAGLWLSTLILALYTSPVWITVLAITLFPPLFTWQHETTAQQMHAQGWIQDRDAWSSTAASDANAYPLIHELGERMNQDPALLSAATALSGALDFARFEEGAFLIPEALAKLTSLASQPALQEVSPLLDEVAGKQFTLAPSFGDSRKPMDDDTPPGTFLATQAMWDLAVTRCLTDAPERAWDHFLAYIRLIELTDGLPGFLPNHRAMNAGTDYLIAVASVLDHHAPAPTQELRTAILSAIRSLTTVSEEERSLIRQYLFLEASGEGTANLAFEDAFPVGQSPLLEHMRVSRLVRTRFLKQLRDHPTFPFGIEHQQQNSINLATMFIPVREHLRLAPLMQAQAQPDFLDMMATQYQKAALLLEAGWAIRDYHTLHATPPPSMEALRRFLSSQDSYAIDLDLLEYELQEQGYRLQIIETIDWLPEVDEDFPVEDEEEAMTLEEHTPLTWLGHGSSPYSISRTGDEQY